MILMNKTIHTILTEKAMAPHSSTLVWKIPWTEEPSVLQSMESQRVRNDLATKENKPLLCPVNLESWDTLNS